MTNTPAISVIIPMYDAERYLGECLESILAQTLKNFEVILVNDCSTDNCRAVAESYIEKFDGRLKIFDNEENSGAGVTRNNGLLKSSGKYVFFMDSDDMILADGLERMYKIAEYFDVDFLTTTQNYKIYSNGKIRNLVNLKPTRPENKPILESNLKWRIKCLFAGDDFTWAPWRKLLRREFLIKNEIIFPEKIVTCEDEIWTHSLMFHAKKIIHVPLPVYLYRLSDTSLTKVKRTNLEIINMRMNTIIRGLNWLDDLMNKVPFFEENPAYRYAVLENAAQRYFEKLYKKNITAPPKDMYLSIKEEFGDLFGEYDLVVPVLCTMINKYIRIIAEDKARIAELEKKRT